MDSKKCLRVGITGGIGSGKSLICKMFNELGIPIYNADLRARWLLEFKPEIIEQVKSSFGEESYLTDGQYNRSYVAKVAFSNPEKLQMLNQIVHPAVEQDSREWHEDFAEAGFSYTLKEAALMIESGSHQHLDFLIVVVAPEGLRIKRVLQREKISEADVRRRIASQLPDEEKIKFADAVILNDGSKSLIQQVVEIHRKLTVAPLP